MSTAKSRLCTKLGISENTLKGGNLFSPDSKMKSFANDSKLAKGEKAIKYLSSANITKKGSSSGVSAYHNYRIDILVPYSDPPKSLITPENKRFYNKSTTLNTINTCSSPSKNFNTLSNTRRSNANSSYLDNLSMNMKLGNSDVYSPFNRTKTNNNSELTGKIIYSYFNHTYL
jgi:hypothetical protein